MKRIIEGATYNTETATILHKYKHTAVHRSDFAYYEETLYRTRSGRYFLLGEGGPCSPYWAQNDFAYSEAVIYGMVCRLKLVPLTNEEAIKWLEQFEAPEEICPELFGEAANVEHSESIIYLRLPYILKSKLENLASQENQSLNTFLIKALECDVQPANLKKD